LVRRQTIAGRFYRRDPFHANAKRFERPLPLGGATVAENQKVILRSADQLRIERRAQT